MKYRLLCFFMLHVAVLGFVLFTGCDVGSNRRGSSKVEKPPKEETVEEEPTPSEPDETSKTAGVGATGKGNDYNEMVYGAVPLREYHHIRERIVFDMTIPAALKNFNAMEGRDPKSNDEFMEKIIKENMIKLPQLPDGDRYEYDPETKQLMIWTKKPR